MRRDTYSRSPIWGFDSPSATAGHGLLGRGEALPAELRAAARPAAAPPDTRVAQYRLGPGEIARGAKPLVDLKGVLNQGPTAVSISTLGESGARVFGGLCEFQRPGALGVCSDGHLKDLGIVVSQSPAVQRSACKRGDLVVVGQLCDVDCDIMRPSGVACRERGRTRSAPMTRYSTLNPMLAHSSQLPASVPSASPILPRASWTSACAQVAHTREVERISPAWLIAA